MIIIEKLHERFQMLTVREKVIVTAALITLLWGIWDKLFWSPGKRQQKQLQQELGSLERQLTVQQQAALKLESESLIDPDLDSKNKLKELNDELERLQQQIALEGKKFVPPRLMAQALSDILTQNRQLTFIRLDTLPATTLRTEKEQFFPIYKHGMTLTFSGDYFYTLRYLKALESLPWRINWDSIDYRVNNYPLAETTVRAYTLSFEESWLGV